MKVILKCLLILFFDFFGWGDVLNLRRLVFNYFPDFADHKQRTFMLPIFQKKLINNCCIYVYEFCFLGGGLCFSKLVLIYVETKANFYFQTFLMYIYYGILISYNLIIVC